MTEQDVPDENPMEGMGMMQGKIVSQGLSMLSGLLESGQLDPYLHMRVAEEQAMIAVTREIASAVGVEQPPAVDESSRLTELRQAMLAKCEGDFPEWWVQHYSGLDNIEDAVSHVGREWSAVREDWVGRYDEETREEWGDADLVEHTATRHFGAPDVEHVKSFLTEWGDRMEKQRFVHVLGRPMRQAEATLQQISAEVNDERPEGGEDAVGEEL